MLKLKITKEEFEKLPDSLKGEYVEGEDGYRLDVDGMEDTGALKRAKDHEANARKEAQKELKELRAKMAEFEDKGARDKGDIEALDKSWSKKLESAKAEAEAKLSTKDAFISKTLVDNVATKIATEISTSPSLLMPLLKTRLVADLDGETPSTKVLDANGQPSAMTVDELRKEFVANKEFAAIMIGSKASGSGASSDGKNKANRVGGMTGGEKDVRLADMDSKQLVEHVTAIKDTRS